MAITGNEIDKNVWVLFSTNINGPKLAWLEARMDEYFIDHRRSGMGINGPILQVRARELQAATSILKQQIGMLDIEDIIVTWDDLPNNHPVFLMNSDPDISEERSLVQPALEHQIMELADGTKVDVYEVLSSHISAIGMNFTESSPLGLERSGELYVRFKGGVSTYKYTPVTETQWHELCYEALKKLKGIKDASVGSLFHHLVKFPAQTGRIKCYKLDTEYGQVRWTEILPINKNRK